MIRIHAYSRLHFGLLNPFSGVAPRQFGGVGLMVCDPPLMLSMTPADSWLAQGPQAARALEFAQRFAAAAPAEVVRPQRLFVEAIAPEHVGLGSGTQLALAVGRALATTWGWEGLDAPGLAERLGRGKRSAIGIHGFQHGGFLVEAGKTSQEAVAQLDVRLDFPEHWRVVLAIPRGQPGLHGRAEIEAFARLRRRESDAPLVQRLGRLARLELVPALRAQDIGTFGEALFDFNRLAGEAFADVQGGIYAAPCVEALIRFFRSCCIAGVAQSSWGPTVAAITESEDQADGLIVRLSREAGLPPVQQRVTRGCNRGAFVSTL